MRKEVRNECVPRLILGFTTLDCGQHLLLAKRVVEFDTTCLDDAVCYIDAIPPSVHTADAKYTSISIGTYESNLPVPIACDSILYVYKGPLRHDHASAQMLVARSFTSCNFFFMSAAVIRLPSSCDANPHCGDTLIRCSASSTVSPVPLATIRAASSTRPTSWPLSSSRGNLLVIKPKTIDLCLGRYFSGSNVPASLQSATHSNR